MCGCRMKAQSQSLRRHKLAQTCTWETLFKIQTSARSDFRKVLNSVESLGNHLTWKRLSADDLDLVMTTSSLRGDADSLSRAGPKQIAHRVRSSARTPSRSTFLKASAGNCVWATEGSKCIHESIGGLDTPLTGRTSPHQKSPGLVNEVEVELVEAEVDHEVEAELVEATAKVAETVVKMPCLSRTSFRKKETPSPYPQRATPSSGRTRRTAERTMHTSKTRDQQRPNCTHANRLRQPNAKRSTST